MLVLTRRQGESVTLVVPPSAEPQTIVVKVDARVRMGFECRQEVQIKRTEIQDQGGSDEHD